MRKRFWTVGVLTLALALSAGCGQKPGAAPNEPDTGNAGQVEPTNNEKPTESPAPQNTQTGTQGSGKPAEPVKPQEKKAAIKMFYTDPDAMELKEAKGEITYKDDQDKYTKAFQALQKSDSDQLVPLWRDSIKLTSLKFEKGALTLDIVKPAEANLGAGGESMAIEALQNMFFQFEEVKSIELLVEGQQVESLMGHVELMHPMTR